MFCDEPMRETTVQNRSKTRQGFATKSVPIDAPACWHSPSRECYDFRFQSSGEAMRFTRFLFGSALAALSCTAARAEDPAATAAKFGARPTILTASISPDGDRIVFVGTRKGGGENAAVVDLATTRTVPVYSSNGNQEHLMHCQFILADRVVCGLYLIAGSGSNIDAATRMISAAADGSEVKMLSARTPNRPHYYTARNGGWVVDYNVPGEPNSVLMTSVATPEQRVGTILARQDIGLGVEKVDVKTLKRAQVERPRERARSYVSDGLGHIRLMSTMPTNSSGYAEGVENFFYRPADGGEWAPLSSVEINASGLSVGFEPLAIDAARNVVYGTNDYQGNTALFQRALDGSGKTDLLLHSPLADIDSLIQIGRSQRVVGASYVTEKRLVEYFDPDLRKLATSLTRVLPGNPQISFWDATHDEQKLLVLASSDTNPGTLYLYDRTTKKLGELLPLRDELVGATLATMKPVTFPARDGTMIPGYLTLPPGSDGKNIPAIVMPHGGPAARDEWGFDWLVQFYAARGFAVLQPNYRGSTGYGASWFEKNGFQSWPIAMNDVIDAGRWLVQSGTTRPGKLAIVGWSYGGYAALQTAVVDPDVFKAIVAIAPVTDLDKWKEQFRYRSNFRIMERYVGSGPHIDAGSPARHADRFKAPVLLVHGDRDMNVSVAESHLMRDRLNGAGKAVDYIEFPDLDHGLDSAEARTRMLTESDRFLRKALGL